jgi:outer membrane lipoprotein-sorting protein
MTSFIRSCIAATALVMVLTFSGHAAEKSSGGDWRSSLETIRAAIDRVTSVKASFVQEKHMKILIKPLVSKGDFYFRKPGSLRWEYKTPVRSVLIFHNAKTRYFSMGASGLTESAGSGVQAMQVGLQEITRWMSGRFDENPAFSMKLVPGGTILLTAKDPSIGRFVQKIEIRLAKEPGGVESAWIYESQDSYTRLNFDHSTFNETLKPDVFTDVR